VTGNLLRNFELPGKLLIRYFAGNERGRVGQIV
jgi:hypothetical protein